MFRLRSKSGDESVFRSAEEIRSALLSGFVTPDAQIWDAELKGWVPLLEHALYQQIAATPGGRKSASVKAPPAGAPKPPPKLVIKRPGDAGTTAMPAVKPPAPPPATPVPPPASAKAAPPAAPKPSKPAEEIPDLELIDLDLSTEPAPVAVPPPPVTPPAPPKRPTPAVVVAAPVPAPPRVSTPRAPAPEPELEGPPPMRFSSHMAAQGGSKKGLVLAAIVVLAGAGGGFAYLRGRGGPPTSADSTAVATPAATPVVTDSAADSAAATAADTTHHDSTATTPPAQDSAPVTAPAPAAAAAKPATPPADTSAPVGGIDPVAIAPTVERGAVPWSNRPAGGPRLSIPALEAVRARYATTQDKALQQFEAGLEVAEFANMFAPAKAAQANARQAAFDAVDAARSALRDYRRHLVAIDFAYTDTLRGSLPPGSDAPDLRTFGPLLRESAPQAALTDSLLGEMADMYGMLISEAGGYTIRGSQILWKDVENAAQYQSDQERLTAQLARIRLRSPTDIPAAMGAVLRGIGLPR